MTNEPSELQDEESNNNVDNDMQVDDLPSDEDHSEFVEQETDLASADVEPNSDDVIDVYHKVITDSDQTEPIETDTPPVVDSFATDDGIPDDESINDYATDEGPVADEVIDEEPINEEPIGHDQAAAFGAAPQTGSTGFPGTAVPTDQYVPLLRDSSGVLGGVASGFGKRYGLDVSLVRLGIVALAFSGFGILAYLAAWIIIPKSAVPLVASPPHPDQTRKALGAILVGAAVTFGLSALGSSGAVLVPLTLLGAGIWLLMQPPTPETNYNQMQTQPPGAVPQTTTPPQQTYSAPAGAYGSTHTNYAAPAPVQKRKSRTGLKVLGGLLAFATLLFLAGIAVVGAIVASEPDVYFEANDDNFQLNLGDETTYRLLEPTSLDEIPEDAFNTNGTLTLDLTDVDLTATDRSTPASESEFGVGNGVLEVLVPEDLDVRFKTNVDSGSITYFDDFYDGNNLNREFGSSDPDVILDLNVDDGSIIITEG